MKIGKISSTQRRYDPSKVSTYGLLSYGDGYRNDYPQLVKRIVSNSVSGSSCLKAYSNFIKGQGFIESDLPAISRLLPQIADDLALFGGFALVINYNANYEISSVYHIPFENVRLALNGKGVKIHPDWARENTSIKQFDARDIVNLPFYNPENVEEEVKEVGDIRLYNGQCFYYSNKGEHSYPLPIFDAALVDMSTEEAISDITHRNAKNGFYPAGMFVNVSSDADTDDNVLEYVKKMQGSQEAAKIGYAQVANETEIPRFVNFNATNYDKDFQVSREAVKQNIIKSFNIPPILASEDIGAGFGADLIENAYKFYNAITRNERSVITESLNTLYPDYDWTIGELRYTDTQIDKDKVLEVILMPIDDDKKRKILTGLYNLTEEEVEALL